MNEAATANARSSYRTPDNYRDVLCSMYNRQTKTEVDNANNIISKE